MAERDRRRLAVIAAHLVGVRRAELALHLPDQVGQLGARRHALEQRCVAAIDRVPVDARHVGRPRTGRAAGARPRAASAAIPCAARRDADAIEIDPAALARRRVRRSGRFARRSVRACSAAIARRRLPSRTTSVMWSAASAKRSAFSTSVSVRSVAKSKSSSRPGRFLVAAAAVRADDRHARVQTTLSPATPAICPKRFSAHRERARRGARCRRGRREAAPAPAALVAAFSAPGGRRRRLQAFRRGIERRRAAGLQRDQVRPRRARETELELHAVVDRVEGAQRQEVEILAVGVERRRVVAELRLRDQRAARVARLVAA